MSDARGEKAYRRHLFRDLQLFFETNTISHVFEEQDRANDRTRSGKALKGHGSRIYHQTFGVVLAALSRGCPTR